MKLQRAERDYYVLNISTTPALAGTWQASFDEGATWIDGTVAGSGWAWLIAGPDYDAAAVSQDPADTQATLTGNVLPMVRMADNPVLDVEYAPRISVVS